MKRIFSLFLALFLLFSLSSFAEYDLKSMSNEELTRLIEDAQAQLSSNMLLEEDQMVQKPSRFY